MTPQVTESTGIENQGGGKHLGDMTDSVLAMLSQRYSGTARRHFSESLEVETWHVRQPVVGWTQWQ